MSIVQPGSPPIHGAAPNLALGRWVTLLLVGGPLWVVALVALAWRPALQWRDLALATALYLVTGHGVTVGFHRLFTHRSFKAVRPLELGLAVAGSFAVQGSLLGWVAIHRRHHAYSDRAGDPHSPHDERSGPFRRLRGLSHAHVGWLFGADTTTAERFAPDLLRDRGLVWISRLFPMWAVLSLALPFAIGWAWSQTLSGALSAMLWAGVARMALLHHVTWSVNSICHTFGRRPYATHDASTNFAPLAIVSMGESWHNFHHAVPNSARHGIVRGQVDSSAAVIRLLERLGWASEVRWPSAARVRQCRRDHDHAVGNANAPHGSRRRARQRGFALDRAAITTRSTQLPVGNDR